MKIHRKNSSADVLKSGTHLDSASNKQCILSNFVLCILYMHYVKFINYRATKIVKNMMVEWGI